MSQANASDASGQSIPPAVLRALLRVPPLSRAAASLHSLDEEKADLRTVASLIGTDPALSALVLRMVNSPLFGIRHPVTGILQAVALLGVERLRAVATTAALRMFVSPAAASPALTRCWRHSVACALASQEMAISMGSDADHAYTAGLLHDIGRFAMLSFWPKEYAHLLATCPPADLLRVESESLGVSHTEAGAFLLKHWGLPAELAMVAREHHRTPVEGRPRVVELVSGGCQLADSIGFAVTATPPADELSVNDILSSLVSDQSAFCLRVADGINQIECL